MEASLNCLALSKKYLFIHSVPGVVAGLVPSTLVNETCAHQNYLRRRVAQLSRQDDCSLKSMLLPKNIETITVLHAKETGHKN
jgi:hypothetical protein